MDKWEYDAVNIRWDEERQHFAVLHRSKVAPQKDLRDLLNANWGEEGWEIISLEPREFYNVEGAWRAVEYKLVAKRRKA